MVRVLIILLIFLSACSTSKKFAAPKKVDTISGLRFHHEFILPNDINFQNTIVGGLSGIDYDLARDQYYLVCDDPSTKGPARVYTAKIRLGHYRIDTVIITKMTPLLNPQSLPYADITKDRIHSADVEALRYDAKRNEMIWTSEGQRYIRPDVIELQNPSIIIMDTNGVYKDSLALPGNMHVSLENKGPRHNSVFEGVTFDESHNSIFVAVEDALHNDGPRASINDSTAWLRILKFDRKSGRQIAQYAYQSDPVPSIPNPPNAFKINGISDILHIGNNRLIVVERAWSTGHAPSEIRVYLADLSSAEDISSVESIFLTPTKSPITKKLLIDMNSLGIYTDNIEGVCLGPVLPNGNQSLIFVADNNFYPDLKSQFFLFEIIP